MAFEEIKNKGGIDAGMEGDRGLVAGRSQREKRRSYKDLLREEEEIAAQVRKSSKKRPKDSELFALGGDSHKKKKKHSDDYYYRDHDGSGPPSHKKKHKSADRSPTPSSHSSSHPTDTAMGLLQAITSPLATGSDPSPHLHKKPSYPPFSSHSSKDRKREGSSGSKGSHSFAHSRPEEPLTLREADGLKMKLIMSPEKEEGESFPFTPHSSKGGGKKEKDRDRTQHSKAPKKKQQQSHYGGGMGDDSSSSGAELEAGELVIDDSYTHMSKKKKKSKKSKKKKDKEKDRDKEKSGKDKKHKQPGLVFGELSKRLAEVWKAMPEKDKLVWRQKAQYLQHKQNKAEATTVKHKSVSEGKSKAVGAATGMVSPNRASGAISLSPARVPDVDPIDAAAHLQLLGESLSLIGHRLQETEGMVAVSGSLSVLLDSILCALGPLTCLTAQIPQLNGCPRIVLSNTLDNIAYIMPGL
uniref:HMG box domain containing 4a n=1 Tax=Cyclopterus lumpus TaxID=8103 RepID=A0A8C2ZZ44_CYCLU